jgi:hypothetical protein
LFVKVLARGIRPLCVGFARLVFTRLGGWNVQLIELLEIQAAFASVASAASSPQAEQTARETADTATRGVARASWFSFAALLVGAIIAIVSGGAGFRHQPRFEESGRAATGLDTPPVCNRAVPGGGLSD